MEEKQSNTPLSDPQSPSEEEKQGSASEASVERQEITEAEQQQLQRALTADIAVKQNLHQLVANEKTHQTTSVLLEDQSAGAKLQNTAEQPQDKGKEPEMSYPGDYYHSGMGSAQCGRGQATSSSTTRSSNSSSNASTPCQGSESGRGENKKDDRLGSGGGEGANGSSSRTGRSRLVAGVFVRY